MRTFFDTNININFQFKTFSTFYSTKKASFANMAYKIPAAKPLFQGGAEVTGNISLNGTFSPNPSPILYVAGN